MLAPLGITVRSLDDAGLAEEVAETGATFAANAALKAVAVARATGLPALGDDSGLAVDALGGAPGVYSARWAGDVSDAARNALLLERLRGVPEERRTARFVCVVAVCHPNGASAAARGEVLGRIAPAPTGDGGFGYDPLFVVQELGRTFAQLTREEKNARSHRARAIAALAPLLPPALGRL